MWAPTFEFVLGIWLTISWIIFGYRDDSSLLIHDFLSFSLIARFSLGSFFTKLRHLHLLNFLVVAWLVIFSYYLRSKGFENNAQNYMTVAWLLFMFSIVPSHAENPPYQWIKFQQKDE